MPKEEGVSISDEESSEMKSSFLVVVVVEYEANRYKVRITIDNNNNWTEITNNLIQRVAAALSSIQQQIVVTLTTENTFIYDPSLQVYRTFHETSKELLLGQNDKSATEILFRHFGRRILLRVTDTSSSSTIETTQKLAIMGRYYPFPGHIQVAGHKIVIQEESNTPNAGTAINVWDGAVLLARYLAEETTTSSQFVHGKAVLELGAGCGLVGITAGVLGASTVVLTDLPEALERLQYNVSINQSAIPATTQMICTACDWNNPPSLDDLRQSAPMMTAVDFDVIVVADCVWMEELVQPLFRALRRYLAHKSTTTTLISYQRRGKATNDAFWKELNEVFTSVEELSVSSFSKPDVFHLLLCAQ